MPFTPDRVPASSPPSGFVPDKAEPSSSSYSAIGKKLMPPGKYTDEALKAAETVDSPDFGSKLAMSGQVSALPELFKLLKGAGSVVGSKLGQGVANDVVGIISPRAAKLASFLGKTLPKAAPAAEEAAGPMTSEAESLTAKGVSQTPSAGRPKFDPFTKKIIP